MSLRHSFSAALIGGAMLFTAPAIAQQAAISPETQATIDLAEGFYEDVLVYRNLNNFSDYIGDVYIQHAPAYGDGPAKMMAAVASELTADPDVDIRLYRTIAEGPYAAIHSVWTTSDGTQYVYVDVWRAEDGMLVEHWDHYQTIPTEAANNNTMYAGPDANIYSTQDIEQNRQRAIAVVTAFDDPANPTAVEDYVAESYIQHNPSVEDGRAPFLGYLASLAEAGTRIETMVAKTIAMGDMVLVHSRQTDPAKADDLGTGYMDIFRFNDDGMIVEHWDVEEKVPAESNNDNDIFGYPAD